MNILHVAPMNVAGVPYNMVEMHRRFGNTSRLVTLHRNDLDFPEDLCLNLPLSRNPLASAWRQHKASSAAPAPRILEPHNWAERLFFSLDDWRREKKVLQAVEEFGLGDFSIIHYDGGVDLFRDARLAQRWKKEGKRIVCHYMGSDLRLRGIHPRMDEISDLNITNESDHLHLHHDIHYLFIPFDVSPLKMRTEENDVLRIIHSPSKRSMKGTELILPVIQELKKHRRFEFILAEHLPHQELMKIKQTCDLAIEQVGNMGGTGYGRNSLENLALGIPTVTEMTPDYMAWIPDNPFILATPGTLLDRLAELLDHSDLRREKRQRGRAWVERYHSYESVNHNLMKLYADHGIS